MLIMSNNGNTYPTSQYTSSSDWGWSQPQPQIYSTLYMSDELTNYKAYSEGTAIGMAAHGMAANVDITGIPGGAQARSYAMGGFGSHPGGWSGWGSYADPYAQQQMPVWDRQISGLQNIHGQVTNTHYYHPNAFEQNLNYWDNRAYTLGSSSSSYGNLGYTLDSVAPGISDLMDQSTGPLAGYSVTGNSLNGLLSMF